MTGADAAADQTPAEGDRRRRAPELCPTTPLVAAAGGEEHEGRARKAGRRRPGAARRRRARGERVRCGGESERKDTYRVVRNSQERNREYAMLLTILVAMHAHARLN
jgi:hypothetical protein